MSASDYIDDYDGDGSEFEFTESTVEFAVDGKQVSFIIIHNMPDQFGLSLECAVDNWLARTSVFTAGSLCKYIMSKGVHEAYTLKQAKGLFKKIEE